MFIYIVMAVLGAAVGWYLPTYTDKKLDMPVSIGLGIVGGLLGGLIATLLSSFAVVIFKLLMAVIGAYFLLYGVKRYGESKGK